MTRSIEITSIDDNLTPLLRQTEKDEIEERRKVDCIIEFKETNGQDTSGSQTKKCVNQIFDKIFKDLNNSSIKSCTIFKVNVGLRESNSAAYTPKMVSIGPYHKNEPQLVSMEKYKLLYLQRFLQRNKSLDVESCISELEKLKEDAIKCYDDIEDVDTDEFCKMLLLDGCFVVEFIRDRCQLWEGEEEIFNSNIGCIQNQILRDLMLLENQLPFFILNKLHHMTREDDELSLAVQAILPSTFFVELQEMTFELFIEAEYNVGNIKHLLHAVHMFACHGNPVKESNKNIKWHKSMPNATELSEAGVSFAKVRNHFNSNKDNNTDMKSLFDIKFENGLMTIPCFQVEDETETLLRNLIAFEQQSYDMQPKYFSDFAVFMDYLIDSDKDVNLLRRKGIIENCMGEDKDVSTLFNKIANGVTIYPTFYYNEECIKAYQHCDKTLNRVMANLMRNYFSSPWVGASTVAAIILLILTTIQTILAFTGSVK
ncbi:hypothetical protein MTR67_016556 [Solanum verrucosum]|uniref:Uncharacterized protein n=1 Tax=Solanum verrucosum TaxID=315347 RepID=A0AAF0QM66_SOLVR|nr:putative UPF0481 protein At3g02645 [Solanum verrucosum]WMV23171.1 hypothetical protein MTR67_016556 [Solanum verrucosum]